MRKFVKTAALAVLVLLSVAFTACENTQQSSAPKVEIVERSDLLERINMSYILPQEKVRRLSDKGLNVTFKHFMLTSDTRATFDLVLQNKDGAKLSLPMRAMLNYNHTVENGQDVFNDIQLYWGDVDLYGDSFVVTNMSQPIRFSLDKMEMQWESYDTSFADGGYIVDSVQTGDNIAFLYYTEDREGIAVFDSESHLVARNDFAKTPGVSNLADISGDVFVPARLQNTAHIHETGGTLYTDGLSHSYLYDYANNTLYTGDNTVWKTAVDGDTTYSVYRFENSHGSEQPFVYMAVGEKAGDIIERQTFTIPVPVTGTDIAMSVNAGGQPLLSCAATGMLLTVDFVNDTAYTQFNITEDMLSQKLYTSKDKAYELYSYAHSDAEIPSYHIALKEIATGNIRYIDEIGMINGYYEGETGFADNENIYLLTGENLKIYNTDMTAVSHTFALADYFPLGVISDSYDTRHLVSATAVSEDKFAVVYYEDNLMTADEDRFADIQSKTTLKSVYKVAVFGTDGTLINTYDTSMNVICGWCPVYSYVKGDDMNIVVNYKDTDHIFTKGILAFTDGVFTLSKEYTAPDKW